MLVELVVRNFALIEKLSLSFGPGLNVLTGETGAGKSILIGAINLILGDRAASGLIRRGAEEAEVQALFSSEPDLDYSRILEELGLPVEDDVLIRRVLPRTGRNRIYINGGLATLAQLTALGRELVTVSGQHEHQQLLDPDRQLLILDGFGGLAPLREAMTEAHVQVSGLKAETAKLQREIQAAREKAELLEYQAREIEAANLTPGEDEELGGERDLARNAGKLVALVRTGYDKLYEGSGAIIETLGQVQSELARAVELDGRLNGCLAQIEDAYHQLDDAANFLRDQVEGYEFDPERLTWIEDRLATINHLKRKYGSTIDEVILHGQKAVEQLNGQEERERRLAGLEKTLEGARTRARELAAELSRTRREKALELAGRLTEELRELGMPRLDFQVALNPVNQDGDPGPLGWDEVEFLIAPNPGEDLKPLAKIASGGELSRAMLGLKSLLAGSFGVPTVIFDEVDSGIGGAVAETVGRKIKALSEVHQVLCITHLPQIAAFGRFHHHVFKEIQDGRTVTDIKPLGGRQKIEEIARMLGGANLSEVTLAAAREMVSLAGGPDICPPAEPPIQAGLFQDDEP